jgi:predicted nucleic acid-binding protein
MRSRTSSGFCIFETAVKRTVEPDASYEPVLTRQEQLAAASITAEDVGIVLDTLPAVVESVRLSFRWRPRLKDAADEMVLETAVNGKADRLVTFNLKHLGKAALEFGIRAMRPGEVLRETTERQR